MKEYVLVNAANAATSVTTVPIDIGDLHMYAFQVTLSGSNVAGTLVLSGSLDNSTFIAVDNGTVSVTNSDDVLFNAWNASYRFAKLAWTYSSGAGNITIQALIKTSITREN